MQGEISQLLGAGDSFVPWVSKVATLLTCQKAKKQYIEQTRFARHILQSQILQVFATSLKQRLKCNRQQLQSALCLDTTQCNSQKASSSKYNLPTVQCAVCSVQCAVRSVQCAVCSVQCAVCSAQYVVNTVQCAVCSMQ